MVRNIEKDRRGRRSKIEHRDFGKWRRDRIKRAGAWAGDRKKEVPQEDRQGKLMWEKKREPNRDQEEGEIL